MNTVLKKGPLTRALNVMRQIYKDEYTFYPRTWFLPEELREFCADCRYIHEKQLKSKQVCIYKKGNSLKYLSSKSIPLKRVIQLSPK